MSKPRDGWSTISATPTKSFHESQTTVYAPDAPPKPVLYDAKGNPLTWAKRPLGFQPPERKP